MDATARRLIGPILGFALAVMCMTLDAYAGTLEVLVVAEDGAPLSSVAVYARGTGATEPSDETARAASVDQRDRRFDPHVLVVQAGTPVSFPNHDDVSHHVYSFSPAKSFELPLYKGSAHPPIVFDTPGEVVLGCNIHDGMLGYIYVVDTPYFAVTDARGIARMEGLPGATYTVAAWTPRARPAGLPAAQLVAVWAEGVATAELRVTGRLAPDHDHHASGLTWERY